MTQPLTFAEFQRFIRDRYHERDAARGTAANFMWLMEEVGELATALHRSSGFEGPASRGEDLAGEFADVLGWLATLANMHGVDLEAALRRKYLDPGGALHK
ncbi:MAG: MazG nucleotide pyrophosphohydrolase domain-containing protein [Candidatus Eremiobacterota bacterium]